MLSYCLEGTTSEQTEDSTMRRPTLTWDSADEVSKKVNDLRKRYGACIVSLIATKKGLQWSEIKEGARKGEKDVTRVLKLLQYLKNEIRELRDG